MPPIVGNAFRSGYKTIIYDIKDLQPCQGYSGRAEPCTHSVLTCVMSCAAQWLIYSSCRPQGRAEPCTLNVLTCVAICVPPELINSSCRPQGRAEPCTLNVLTCVAICVPPELINSFCRPQDRNRRTRAKKNLLAPGKIPPREGEKSL